MDPSGALAQLVKGADRFSRTFWGRAPLHVPGASPDGFAHLPRMAG